MTNGPEHIYRRPLKIEPSSPVSDKARHIPYDLLHPHYTDRRFTERRGELTVFLAEGYETHDHYGSPAVEGLHYNYSDRLLDWHGSEKSREAHDKAKEIVGDADSPRYYEEYLRILLDNPKVELVHLTTGVNRGNGYPYHVYGYLELQEESSASPK